ncbi:MAG TPA: PfkB family carbohydrate kinase [Armatimonadota bacterium]|nr:PfkB family carbohydrate kinase [Armatimonadota bacterium]
MTDCQSPVAKNNRRCVSRDEGGAGCGVLVVGSIALDSVQTPFGAVREVLGGAAVYASAAASFFAPVRMVGVVGGDFPREHLRRLEQWDIDISGVEVREGQTFRWSGYYEYDLNQAHTVSTHLNVFEDFHPKLVPAHRDTPYVFLANIDPELQLAVLDQVRAPRLTVCDTMNFWIAGKREALMEVISRVDVALMNDAEARQLCDTHSLVQAARMILDQGPRAVVLKKGEHGASMFTRDGHFSAPAYPLEEVKDPTGAGDSFAGGLIGYLAYTDDFSDDNLRKAIIGGSVIASFDVEDFSLERLARLTPNEIVERYRRFRAITDFGDM